jgi:EmrB/QacA subfamily drug resistance transporter
MNTRPNLVLLAASLGVLIAQIDTSVVNLAVKPIAADLGSSVSAMQWMIDAYNLVYAALLLTAGALGDLYGRRRVFVAGIALFALGSAVCAIAPGTAALLAGRALQGLGAALEVPMSLVLLALAFPEPKARNRALGIWASCNGLAFIVGPTLGGVLVDAAGWRSIFYLILPLCVPAALLVRKGIAESASPASGTTGRRLDLPGQLAAIAALGGLAFAAIEGAHLGWGSPLVLGAAGVAAAGAAAFFLIERRSANGLVPFELFGNAQFSASLAIATLMTFTMYALIFLMPLSFQVLRGDSPIVAGLRMLPMSVAFFLVSQQSGRIVEAIGARASLAGGMALIGAGQVLAGFAPAGAGGAWEVALGFGLAGVGLGLGTAPVNNAAMSNAPKERSGTASGLLNTARMVGATLGVAILGAVFAHFAGQDAAAEGVVPGLRAALSIGGLGTLAGAAIALAFVGREERAPLGAKAARLR